MKQILMLGFFMLVALAKVQAQPAADPCTQRGSELMRFLKDSMGITSTQEAQIRAIQDSTCARRLEVKRRNGGNREAMQREMEVIRKNSMEQIRAVLTEEQKEVLRNKRKARNSASGIPPGL
ncbi:MAG: hypothetical protein RLZZ370_1919 [Bacteroidota bacterium]|jgi:Spy/CpxP family protein refolding chaperone